jgi:hypothetical protein
MEPSLEHIFKSAEVKRISMYCKIDIILIPGKEKEILNGVNTGNCRDI